MSLLTNFARGVKVELIAKLAASYEAYDGGTLIKGVASHNIRDYFRKYGNTARKFEHIADGDIYIGYVRMSGKPEFLSAIVLAGENAVAVSFDSEVEESNDFLTLMAKKEFADRMTLAVQRAAALMRKEAPTIRPAPQAEPKAIAAAQSGPTRKDNGALGWMALLSVGGVLGAIFLIPLLVENNKAAAPSTAGYAVSDSYETGVEYSAPSDTVDRSMAPSSPEEIQGYIGDTPLTYGMLDSIMGGDDAFLAVYRSGGMLEAISYSQNCLSQASASAQISAVDECAAFDFIAQFTDEAASAGNGFPLQDYFRETNARLDAAYARFPEHSPERLALIKGQAAKVLSDRVSGTPN